MKKLNNTENCNWDLLAKYLTNEANNDEKSIVKSWIGESAENRQEFDFNKHLLEKVELLYQTNRFEEAKALFRIQSKIQQNKSQQFKQRSNSRKKIYLGLTKYAAIIAIVFVLAAMGYYFGFHQHSPTELTQIVSTENQLPEKVILPDGSVVTLNSNTTIIFPEHFSNKTREVKIQGEAFFEVKSNPDQPFVITAGEAKIRVLGTSFNVSAYPGTEIVEVIVKSGKVQVLKQLDNFLSVNNVILTAGEKVTSFKHSNKLQKEINNDPNFIAWKTHNLVFNDSPLEYVIQKLEKTYHVEIQISDSGINNLILSAHFNDKPIDFILEVIRLTFNLELLVENDSYILTSRNS